MMIVMFLPMKTLKYDPSDTCWPTAASQTSHRFWIMTIFIRKCQTRISLDSAIYHWLSHGFGGWGLGAKVSWGLYGERCKLSAGFGCSAKQRFFVHYWHNCFTEIVCTQLVLGRLNIKYMSNRAERRTRECVFRLFPFQTVVSCGFFLKI